ncbi:efflux RND transporter periplasmic adaptor subunit [Paracoccus liaowanqingii]|uniref:Efflux RND transporter periplasmic adaptor subunit n=1 Tax=Paracoccus liaowanqingii TaxID=2560053 RepID=A0A4P7HL97_9RHOB|nr:efflux RND transporter periplasmic adaptor subunit [Paracoccus liaowanqingii]QBX34936.1 efflux RND transporter periplasmic adaptor subunit [Paracoccus liaowanqingii]
MRKGILAITCVLAVALGIGAALGFGGPMVDRIMGEEAGDEGDAGPEAQTVRTALAEEAEIVEQFSAVGNTRAIRSGDILPRTAGVVASFDIPSGTRVEAGYGLVQLDDRAERAALRQVEARLGDAQATADRTRELSDRNVAADASLDTALADLDLAQAELDAARIEVDDRRITAPFAGTVGLTDIETGRRLEPTDVITTLDDLSRIEIIFNLPESLFLQVETGQALQATGAGSDRVFTGELSTVGTRIDPVARFFEVRGLFDNADGTLTTGMLMNVDLTLETRTSVTVPELAIVNIGDEAIVFVPEEGQARERTVRTGLLQDGAVEILEGLEAGETVITTGLQAIEDGDAVEPEDEGGEAPEEETADTAAADGTRQ